MAKSTALEPGYYTEGEKTRELQKAMDSADREIECHALDEFSIGVRRGADELTFSVWELSTFLREEKHKDCLLIQTGKGLVPHEEGEEEERKQFIDKLIQSFSKFGYRRILTMGAMSTGYELIADVTPAAPQK
jgi:hypothetical protein